MKRICVLSDGSFENLEHVAPTNIALLAQGISGTDPNGIEQLVFYDAGVGAEGTFVDRTLGLAGYGVDLNIKQLYTCLALNYNPGDEVFFFGYSRGAYTVRSLAGFIHDSGLVRRGDVTLVNEGYELYRKNLGDDSSTLQMFRAEHGDRIPIKLIACFDTVGALGLPNAALGRFAASFNKRYNFHNVKLSPKIEHGIHLLSIDETRASYEYTPMEPTGETHPGQVTQRFFWGTHSGIGGGNEDLFDSSNIVLNFLVREMSRRNLHLSFDKTRIPAEGDPGIPIVETVFSLTERLIYSFSGFRERNIESVEQIHKSAIWRFQNVPEWRPQALEHLKDDLMNVKIGVIDDEISFSTL